MWQGMPISKAPSKHVNHPGCGNPLTCIHLTIHSPWKVESYTYWMEESSCTTYAS